MNSIIKKAFKIISIYKEEGIQWKTLLKMLHTNFDSILSFKNEDVLLAIKNSKEISILTSKGEQIDVNVPINDDDHIVASKNLQGLYLKQNLLNFYFKNDENNKSNGNENEIIFLIYQEICKAGSNGISYNKLGDKFNQKKKKGIHKEKLENYMISSYCCKLAKHNFIKIQFENGSKIAVLKGYNRIEYDKIRKVKKSSNIITINDEEDETEPFPKKKRKYEVTQQNILEKLEKETFGLREFTQRSNILLNLQSYDGQINEGITIKDLSRNIRMKHDKKPLDRILKNLNKIYDIEMIAFRSGKSFSHKYIIRNPKISEMKVKQNNNQSIIHKLKHEENESNFISELQMIKREEIEKSENVILRIPILKEVYQDILEVTKSHTYLMEKINNQIDYYSQWEQMSEEEYMKNSEYLFQLLIENVDFVIPPNPKDSPMHSHHIKDSNIIKDSTKNHFSKRALTRLKFNRYIFVLNKIKEKKTISHIDLKNMIINEIECDSGWKIDRKTLRNILEILERYGLIKIVDFKWSFIPIKESDDIEIKEKFYMKTIILEKNVDPNDPSIDQNPAITNPTLRGDLNFPETLKEKDYFKERAIKKEKNSKSNIKLKIEDLSNFVNTKDKIDSFKKKKDDLKRRKQEFEIMEGPMQDRLKKFDFGPCKLLALEYKVMLVFTYMELLFTKLNIRSLRLAFHYLKSLKTKSLEEEVKDQIKSFDNSLYKYLSNMLIDSKYYDDDQTPITTLKSKLEGNEKSINIHDSVIHSQILREIDDEILKGQERNQIIKQTIISSKWSETDDSQYESDLGLKYLLDSSSLNQSLLERTPISYVERYTDLVSKQEPRKLKTFNDEEEREKYTNTLKKIVRKILTCSTTKLNNLNIHNVNGVEIDYVINNMAGSGLINLKQYMKLNDDNNTQGYLKSIDLNEISESLKIHTKNELYISPDF